MILPPRVGASRRQFFGRRTDDPSLSSCVLGTGGFLVLAALGLYLLAHLGS